MRQVVLDGFLAFTESFEGATRHMYLDVKRLVTIGWGNLIDPQRMVAGITFQRPDGSICTVSEVSAAWMIVKNDHTIDPRSGGGAYARLTSIRATEESLRKLVASKLAQNEAIALKEFPCFESWPAKAQLALMSMDWAYGAAFPDHWPHFKAACLAHDWKAASAQASAGPSELAKQNDSFRRRNARNVELFAACADPNDDPESIAA